MPAVVAYATARSIEVIPALSLPDHAQILVSSKKFGRRQSKRLDLGDDKAVKATKAFLREIYGCFKGCRKVLIGGRAPHGADASYQASMLKLCKIVSADYREVIVWQNPLESKLPKDVIESRSARRDVHQGSGRAPAGERTFRGSPAASRARSIAPFSGCVPPVPSTGAKSRSDLGRILTR